MQGRGLLDRLALSSAQRTRIDSALGMIDMLTVEVDQFSALTARRLRGDPGYVAVQAISGVGPVLAAVFVAEIGDVTRFAHPPQLASWAGLTPRHHESDTTVRRGHITKQGSRLVRWAAVEAVQRTDKNSRLGQRRDRIAERRGRNIGKVAAARDLLELVFYGLRDGHIRALNTTPAA